MKNLGKASRTAGCPQQSNQGRHGTNGPAQAVTVRPGKIRSANPPFPGQSRTPQSQSAARQSRPGLSGAWPPIEASSWWSESNSYPLCLLKWRQGGTETCGNLDTLQWRGWGQAGGCCPPTLGPVALLPGCPCCSDGTHQGQVSPLSAVSDYLCDSEMVPPTPQNTREYVPTRCHCGARPEDTQAGVSHEEKERGMWRYQAKCGAHRVKHLNEIPTSRLLDRACCPF